MTAPGTTDRIHAVEPVVELRQLSIELDDRATGRTTRIGPVDLTVQPGTCLCIVGRSGAGKSTLGLSLLGMLPPGGRVVGGDVRIRGRSLFALPPKQLRRVRGGDVTMIFQDPAAALNPLRRIDRVFADVVRAQGRLPRSEMDARVRDAVRAAQLEPDRVLRCYPHELSGGMRQRVAVALALVNQPVVVVADEPTTALDPSTQLELLELLSELRRSSTLVVITHDLRVARRLGDVAAVMDGGLIAELGPCRRVLDDPRHQVTKLLVESEHQGPAALSSPTPGSAQSDVRGS